MNFRTPWLLAALGDEANEADEVDGADEAAGSS
jgi:hypothetical protein